MELRHELDMHDLFAQKPMDSKEIYETLLRLQNELADYADQHFPASRKKPAPGDF